MSSSSSDSQLHKSLKVSCDASQEYNKEIEKVLCKHCFRTANNGKKCIGKCVADSEY